MTTRLPPARTGRRMAVRTLLAAVLGAALLAPGAAVVAAAPPTEQHPIAADGALRLSGLGWGHGRGMSQYGAYHAASQGRTQRQILAFYYPGTAFETQADLPIRVRITRDTYVHAQVLPVAGLAMRAGSDAPVVLPADVPAGHVDGWRVRRDAGGDLVLEHQVGTQWSAWAGAPASVGAGPVSFGAPLVTVVFANQAQRTYRTSVRAIKGSAGGTDLIMLAVMPLEQYLLAVVPSEMPALWPAEAVKAQAVAARTYASYERRDNAADPYDTCDTTQCQVFPGTSYRAFGSPTATQLEHPASTAAVQATAGEVRTYNGGLAFTQFGSSNGGYSVAGQFPYLVAQPDPYESLAAGSGSTWTATLTSAQLQARFPTIGMPRSVTVERDTRGRWGGRTTYVAISGTSGVQWRTGDDFAALFGLRSPLWALTGSPLRRSDLNADGVGDLVGRETSTGRLWLYRGSGTGSFGSRSLLASGWAGMRAIVAPGDLTADTFADLLAVDATGRLLEYDSSGAGTLLPATVIGIGWAAFASVMSPGDWTGDGRPDLLAVAASTGRLYLYPGRAGGGFASPTAYGTGWLSMTPMVGMDVTGDFRSDVVAVDRRVGRLFYYPNLGGRFGTRVDFGFGWNAMSHLSSPGDLNRDGFADLLAVEAATGRLWLYPTNGTSFRARQLVGGGWGAFNSVD